MHKKILGLCFLMIFAASSMYILNGTATTQSSPKTATVETLGAFIIIAGDRSDHDKQSLIMGGCDKVYNMLINNLGFSASRVYYLGSNVTGHPNVQAISTWTNIKNTIETWANNKVDSSQGLGLYLFDHGGTDAMAIPGGSLTDTDLNSFLNNLQSSTGCSRNIIVYEACEAGSFISTISKTNRIFITSTDATHSAYASSDWAYFSESFWPQIAAGNPIGTGFILGSLNVIAAGYAGQQTPLLDDNADKVGHTPIWITFPSFPWYMPPLGILPNGGDGFDAMNTIIRGSNAPIPIYNPEIALTSHHTWYANTTTDLPIWATVKNTSRLTHLWARVMPPYWSPQTPPAPDVNGSHIVQDNIPPVELIDATGDGNYTGFIFVGGAGPPILGDYRINLIPEGATGFGPIVTSVATLNDNGMAPPDTTPPGIGIINPQSCGVINGTINVMAYGDDDQSLNKVELFIDGVSVSNQTMPNTAPYPMAEFSWDSTKASNGVHEIEAIATDSAGLQSTTSISVQVQNNPGAISGYFPLLLAGASIMGFIYIARRKAYRFHN